MTIRTCSWTFQPPPLCRLHARHRVFILAWQSEQSVGGWWPGGQVSRSSKLHSVIRRTEYSTRHGSPGTQKTICRRLAQNLDFGVDCDSRVAIVGPNGAGGASSEICILSMCTRSVVEVSPPSSSCWMVRWSQPTALSGAASVGMLCGCKFYTLPRQETCQAPVGKAHRYVVVTLLRPSMW